MIINSAFSDLSSRSGHDHHMKADTYLLKNTSATAAVWRLSSLFSTKPINAESQLATVFFVQFTHGTKFSLGTDTRGCLLPCLSEVKMRPENLHCCCLLLRHGTVERITDVMEVIDELKYAPKNRRRISTVRSFCV